GIPPQSRAASRVFPRFLERYLDERAVSISDAVVTAARGLDVPPSQVALAWSRDTPGVSAVLVGARTLTQLQTALGSESIDLPGPVRDALDDVSA
ncbi:MAG TPA: aldo/keto reductase, partial [Dermatophilaceae bacterium]|nr:aldo/keto reductase [Dermatophilaceae bacterium]